MRLLACSANWLRTLAAVACLALPVSGLVGCGADGNITVGVVATKPPPDLPTLTPVPPATSTPQNTVAPTLTVRPTNTPEPSNCCSEHAAPGCDDSVCEACVCDVDPDDFCCGEDGAWDGNCVDITQIECVDACPCQ